MSDQVDKPALLPCPFCEGKAEEFRSQAGARLIRCTNDSCPIDHVGILPSDWNRRASGAAKVVPALPTDERAVPDWESPDGEPRKAGMAYATRLGITDPLERAQAILAYTRGHQAGWQARASQPAVPADARCDGRAGKRCAIYCTNGLCYCGEPPAASTAQPDFLARQTGLGPEVNEALSRMPDLYESDHAPSTAQTPAADAKFLTEVRDHIARSSRYFCPSVAEGLVERLNLLIAHAFLNTAQTPVALLREARDALDELARLMNDVRTGDYTPDTFTTQPAELLLAKLDAALATPAPGSVPADLMQEIAALTLNHDVINDTACVTADKLGAVLEKWNPEWWNVPEGS